MEYGRISGIDKPVSRLVQGTIMCQTDKQAEVNTLLDAVYAQGINTFDTAHVYGDGECERAVGRWIHTRGLRDQVVLIGKGAHHNADRQRVTPFDISADIYDSLARLQTNYIDLYLLHRDDPTVPVEPIIDRLYEHQVAGHILAYGVSNWSYERIATANTYAQTQGLLPIIASSPNFSLASQAKPPWPGCVSISGSIGKAARQWYGKHRLALFTWSSLAGGFLSGRFTPDNLESFTNYLDRISIDVYCFDENWEKLARVKQMATEKGVSVAQIALAYVLNQPLDIYALIAVYNAPEASDSTKAIDIKLTPAELSWLEEG